MIWLDLDDTIWDMKGNSLKCLGELYFSEGIDNYLPCKENWLELYETVNKRLWAQYADGEIDEPFLRIERFACPLRLCGIKNNEAKEKAVILDKKYLQLLGDCDNLVPGARELLALLKTSGCRLGILSNGFMEVQHRKLKSSKIEEFFDTIVLSGEIGIPKPDVRLYRYAEQKASVRSKDCLMIGDSIATDIQGAVNAGWETWWFNSTGNKLPESLKNTVREFPSLLKIGQTLAKSQKDS